MSDEPDVFDLTDNALQPQKPIVDFSLPSVPFTSPIFLGVGYDPRTFSTKNRAVQPISEREQPSITFEPTYTFEYVENRSEMIKQLGVSMAASYGYSGMSASGSLTLMQNTTVKYSRAYVVFKMTLVVNKTTIETTNLVDQALNLVTNKKYQSLVRAYGSHFARSIYWGGELACILEFVNESSSSAETFKASINASVGAAKTENSYTSAVTTLTSGRRVSIRYTQRGGNEGKSNRGILTITPEELNARIIEFPAEVKGTTGLDGSNVALSADMERLTMCANWPEDDGTDIDAPYPPNIISIAESIGALQNKYIEVEGVLESDRILAPSIKEAATEIKSYLDFLIPECKRSLSQMMSEVDAPTSLLVESFLQYRIRRLLGAPSKADRSNAGESVNLAENDKDLLLDKLLGKAPSMKISPWPNLAFTGRWGFSGEGNSAGKAEDGCFRRLAVGHHVECGGNIAEEAARLCGKTSAAAENDGIFSFITNHPYYTNGGACGYHLHHFAEVRVLEAENSTLPSLPKTPATSIASIVIQTYMPMRILGGKVILPFTAQLIASISCGSFTINLQIKHNQPPHESKIISFDAYWYKEHGRAMPLRIMHQIDLQEEWDAVLFEPVIHAMYYDQQI